jgi:hypothetical protein
MRRTADGSAGMRIEEVSASPAGQGFDRGGECPVLGFQVLDGEVAAMAGIDIQDEQAADGAGRDAEIGVRPAGPPLVKGRGVGRGVVEAMGGPRMLAGVGAVGMAAATVGRAHAVHREHGPPERRIPPRDVAQGGGIRHA